MQRYPADHNWITGWPADWTPRSVAYRQGYQTGFRGDHRKPAARQNPYKAGSESYDAWFAGLDAGVVQARAQNNIAKEMAR